MKTLNKLANESYSLIKEEVQTLENANFYSKIGFFSNEAGRARYSKQLNALKSAMKVLETNGYK